jgi:hypothetical protein
MKHTHNAPAAGTEAALSNAFSGRSSFSGVTVGNEETFGYVIKNNTDKPVLLALLSGYLAADSVKNQQGKKVDAVIKEGTVLIAEGKEVTCYGDPKPVDELLAYAKHNPLKFKGLTMRVDEPSQFGQAINVQKLSPFKNLGDERVSPAQFKDPKQTNDKLVQIPLGDLQMDANTVITYTVNGWLTNFNKLTTTQKVVGAGAIVLGVLAVLTITR